MSVIGKHVDLIAIGLLLCGITFYAHVRSAINFEVSHARIGFTQRFHNPVVVTPRIPPTPFTHD